RRLPGASKVDEKPPPFFPRSWLKRRASRQLTRSSKPPQKNDTFSCLYLSRPAGPDQKCPNIVPQLTQAQIWEKDRHTRRHIQVVRRQLPAAKHDLTKAHRHSVVLDNPSLRYRDSEKMSSGIFKMAKLQTFSRREKDSPASWPPIHGIHTRSPEFANIRRDASEPAANLFSSARGDLAAIRQAVTGSGVLHGSVSPETHDAAKTAQSIYLHRERNRGHSRFEREPTENGNEYLSHH